MPRKREIQKRPVTPDPKYRSDVVAKFINVVMRRGKKAVAEKIVYGALDLIAQKGKSSPVDLFNQALDNVRPLVEVKSRRVGGATYQVPVEVRSSRQMALAMRWMVEAARVRAGKSMGARLADELLDAAEKRGNAIKKREDVHRMAEANKAFSHYRW